MIPYRENILGSQGGLPSQWEQAYDPVSNRYFYVDHNNKTTTWINPLDNYNKPKSASECHGDELPFGWERMVKPSLGEYYANHLECRNQWTNPVEDWRKILSQPYYSNSHHILSLEQSGDSLDSNNQTTSQTTTDTKPADTSLHASDIEDKLTTSLNNSNTLSTEIIDTMRSNNSTRGSRYDSELVDIMDNCFGRKSSQSVEV
uniref:Protein kibra n=1 Tax=Aceria tosichella TaxID=561515 RepID=A0A6G1SLG8_9ACAR